MSTDVVNFVCRICSASCNLVAERQDGVIQTIRGDKHDPVYYGYSCIKGREAAHVHQLPSRLLHSMKRQADGSHEAIAAPQATTEIAARLKAIVAEHGPRSVALYIGTHGYINFTAHAMAYALMKAIGSPMVFNTGSIDQPGKGIAMALHGIWLAGTPPTETWDVLLLVGSNPLVSLTGGLGVNPARTLKQSHYRGMKLIVVDPRVSESARRADLHLQCKPGEDAAVMAGIVRELLRSELIDREFVDAETQGLDALRMAVEPYTADAVAARAGIRAQDLIAAANMIGAARRGAVFSGTGANMSGQANLVEYLGRALTSLRGWWLRAGEVKGNPGVLIEPFPAIAASPGPFPPAGFGEKLRVRGLTDTATGMPTAALSDEILLSGEGQVKALIVLGGNPMLAWPDQLKTQAAMRSLDLLVSIDPRVAGTGRYAHYVLAPKLPLEVDNATGVYEMLASFAPGWGYEVPYGHVSPPLQAPPAGADVHDEWELLYDIGRHMGLALSVKSMAVLDPARAWALATPLDMQVKPSPLEVWRMVFRGSPVDYDTVRAAGRGGRVFERPRTIVQPRPQGWTGRIQLGSEPMMQDLAEIAAERDPASESSGFPLRLICRRMHDVMNSSWVENPRQHRPWAYNPAFMNPEDLAQIGAAAGDVVEIRSARDAILGIAQPAPEIRRGCVSMSHCWGGNPDEPEQPEHGSNTARLLFTDRGFDRYSGIPLMSAVPVRVSLAPANTRALPTAAVHAAAI
ncbi:MAG: nitrate reductase [Hydrocarboniphaga sp.]|uniref:molybdopterin-containing oxidoreductase family protein n=1 Tax=Hydrocarboniphaga sp. TaxID=2033016 RepID=UPI00260EA7A7|nr:molybdopterin-dependent oxidoreductase [Hydrocarboniphaga sp.]MDB5971379.1 nitrate reductase [Hydrocarboniphaga sp.]